MRWSPVDSPHKGQWRRTLMVSLICAWTNSWANNWDAGDLRCHLTHYDVTVMKVFIEKMHLIVSSAKLWPFCLSLNDLTICKMRPGLSWESVVDDNYTVYCIKYSSDPDYLSIPSVNKSWVKLKAQCIHEYNMVKFSPKYSLTHWGLVTPYDDIDLGHHWFK